MQTIFPILRYNDARTAIEWLCRAFGFKLRFSVPESGPHVRHAQLQLGSSIIMVGSVRPGEGLVSPAALGHSTQALCVYVEDVAAHHQRAHEAGADLTSPPSINDVGILEYHVRDLEGHQWTFGSYLPQVS